jgi:hypothetical protein
MGRPYRIVVKRRVLKRIERLPAGVQGRFRALLAVLMASGPTGPHSWPNYSTLGDARYHCHLAYRHVACWHCTKGTIEIEVYYVGSREDAPY